MSEALETGRAHDAAESLHRRVALLQEACRGALTAQDLVEIAVAQARAAVDAAAGLLFRLAGNDLVPAVSHGYPSEALTKWARTPVNDSTPAGLAVLTRQAVWLADPEEKRRAFPAVAPSVTGYAALAALPVMSGGTVLGVLGVSFLEARELDAVERLFLLVLADQVGEALDRLEPGPAGNPYIDDALLSDPRRRDVVDDIRASLPDGDSGLARLTGLAKQICGVPSAQVSLISADQFVAAAAGAAPATGTVGPAADSLCTITMSQRAPLMVADAAADDRVSAMPPVRSGAVRAYLGVPLLVEGQLAGALCVYDEQPRRWSAQALHGVQTLAEAVATHLRLSRQSTRDDRRLRMSADRARVLDALAAATDPQQVAEALLTAVPAGTIAASVDLGDESGTVLARSASGATQAQRTAIAALAGLTAAEPGAAAETVSLTEVARRAAQPAAQLATGGMRRALLLRLPGRTAVTVLMALDFRADLPDLRERWSSIAAVAAATADRAATHEKHRLAMVRAAFLSTASARLQASLDVGETLQQVARLAVPDLAPGCLVHLWSDAGWSLAADACVDQQVRARVADDAALARALDDVAAGRPREAFEDGLRCLALRARGRLIGAITLAGPPPPAGSGIADEALLADLARHAAMAVDNVLLYAKRGTDLAALQQRLLPARLPVVAGCQLAAYYSPGDEGLDVGGDFYEVIVHSGDRLTLIVGDVCGRGAHAAAVAGIARTVLRAAVKADPRPQQALRRLNAAMREVGNGGELCTVALVDLRRDGEHAFADVAVAGHPPPLLRRGRTVSAIDCRGPMAGLVALPTFREAQLRLDEGDAVVLYTDGLTEARRDGNLFGTDRLAAAVASAGASADSIVATAVHSAMAFGQCADDDVAVLALRLTGPDAAG